MKIRIGLAAVIAAMVVMPVAHTDPTLTQADWCNQSSTVPVLAPFQNFTVCAKPGTVPGLFVALPQSDKQSNPSAFSRRIPS